jgi:TPR repeat protein
MYARKAVEAFNEAVRLGNSEAAYRLAGYHWYGIAGQKNPSESHRFAVLAAQKGHQLAIRFLAAVPSKQWSS